MNFSADPCSSLSYSTPFSLVFYPTNSSCFGLHELQSLSLLLSGNVGLCCVSSACPTVWKLPPSSKIGAVVWLTSFVSLLCLSARVWKLLFHTDCLVSRCSLWEKSGPCYFSFVEIIMISKSVFRRNTLEFMSLEMLIFDSLKFIPLELFIWQHCV